MFNNSLGGQGFTWFIGVVEERTDPLKMGRVRVRCFGYHTDDKDLIPTEELPWATVVNSVDSASISGIGKSPTGIVEGSWVMGFFLDGEEAQNPMILGTIPSMSSSLADTTKGFYDPAGIYPKTINESDVNKLARGEKVGNYSPDDVINEPPSPYNPQYPHNQVFESESGHIKEYDDTAGAERIREKHKSGTFYEIHPDGTKVTRVVSNNYVVTMGDTNIHISRRSNLNVYVDGDCNLDILGDFKMSVGGKTDIISGGNMRLIAPRIDLNPDYATGDTREVEDIQTPFGVIKSDQRDAVQADVKTITKQPCPQFEVGTPAYDNQITWMKKIVNEFLNELNWQTDPEPFLKTWVKDNTEYNLTLNAPDTLNEIGGESDVLVARIDDTYNKGKVTFADSPKKYDRMDSTYFYYYTPEVTKELILLMLDLCREDIMRNSNAEELYGTLEKTVSKSTPLNVFRKVIGRYHFDEDGNGVTYTDPTYKPDANILGFMFYRTTVLGERKDDNLALMETSESPLETILHEIGGHQYHKAKWGEDGILSGKVLLSKEEVDNLYDVFKDGPDKYADKVNKTRAMANVINKFTALEVYSREAIEDEFMARVYSYLALNKCTTFEEHIYPILNRAGVLFTLDTVREIDAEMRSLGLTFNRTNKGYKKDADIAYRTGAVTQQRLSAQYSDPKKITLDPIY